MDSLQSRASTSSLANFCQKGPALPHQILKLVMAADTVQLCLAGGVDFRSHSFCWWPGNKASNIIV